ncbi:MAG: Rne/Rng family ribonuclease [Clostridia bacterium]
MKKQLLIDYHPQRVRVAMVEDGELVEYYMERASMPKLVGNIYKGKVVNTLAGMKAAFVNIGLEKNAFLYVGESLVDKISLGRGALAMPQKLCVSSGDNVLCQVVKDYFGTKGVRISQNISLPGRLMVIMPQTCYIGISHKIVNEEARARLEKLVQDNAPENTGFIIRTAAEKATDEEILSEMNSLILKWKNILASYKLAAEGSVIYEEGDLIFRTIRDILDSDINEIIVNNSYVFRDLKESLKSIYHDKDILELYSGAKNLLNYYNLSGQIEKLIKRKVVLKNGAYLVIDRTEALTVIDVNTGKYVGEDNLEDTFYKTNLIAAEEIAKQLRLRNIGGIVIVDFIDMTIEGNRAQVLEALKSALNRDRTRTSQPVMTTLGLVEFTRKKTRSSINDIILKSCPYCQGDGYIFSEEYVIMRIRDALIATFSDNDPKSVIITVNPDVFSKLFTLRYLEKDCLTMWKGKRIYIVPDSSTHHEHFTIVADNSTILSLPDDAKLLY